MRSGLIPALAALAAGFSFAYGNANIENERVTWEMIVEADEEIKAQLAAK